MVSARAEGCTNPRQSRSRSAVGTQPPSPGHAVVHGPAHDRVPEAKPPRRDRRPDQVGDKQFVERVQRLPLGALGDRADNLRIKRLTRHRGCFHDEPALGREIVKLIVDRGDHSGRKHRRLTSPLPSGLGRRGRGATGTR